MPKMRFTLGDLAGTVSVSLCHGMQPAGGYRHGFRISVSAKIRIIGENGKPNNGHVDLTRSFQDLNIVLPGCLEDVFNFEFEFQFHICKLWGTIC